MQRLQHEGYSRRANSTDRRRRQHYRLPGRTSRQLPPVLRGCRVRRCQDRRHLVLWAAPTSSLAAEHVPEPRRRRRPICSRRVKARASWRALHMCHRSRRVPERRVKAPPAGRRLFVLFIRCYPRRLIVCFRDLAGVGKHPCLLQYSGTGRPCRSVRLQLVLGESHPGPWRAAHGGSRNGNPQTQENF
jgi:hypothetical protein